MQQHSAQIEQLASFEKRFDDFRPCSQQLATLEERLVDLENRLTKVAVVEADATV
ncbi:hypothetical protein DPMN_082569 [Dreissena polymorpha]|uniref:Uncharacterized protein n=1 Tax=Dreissena polymorpha TaxID=45954 RepID=A0A9D3Y756_DREPO|nr:hypothetical protein DPMN_082569 [Dreissena polymorpha]